MRVGHGNNNRTTHDTYTFVGHRLRRLNGGNIQTMLPTYLRPNRLEVARGLLPFCARLARQGCDTSKTDSTEPNEIAPFAK